jgi:hypothetical protein
VRCLDRRRSPYGWIETAAEAREPPGPPVSELLSSELLLSLFEPPPESDPPPEPEFEPEFEPESDPECELPEPRLSSAVT